METPKDSSYVGWTPAQLTGALSTHAQVGSQLHSEIVGALATVLIKDLSESIDKHERAASKLSNRLLWLNIILGIFTVVGTLLAVVSYFDLTA